MKNLEAGYYKKCFWFRLYGYGIWIAWRKNRVKLFSERNGYRKVYCLGRYAIQFLTLGK